MIPEKVYAPRLPIDMLWLPFVTAAYIECTGDTGILEEEVAYLEAEELAPGEFERFFIPEISAEKESVYKPLHKGY